MTRTAKPTVTTTRTSAARRKAARENGRKSNGPRTIQGKISSSKSALKHGLTARAHVVMPGEDPAAFGDFHDAWFADAKPRTMQQVELAENSCRAAWNLRRAAHQGDQALAARARNALDRFEIDRRAGAQRLLRELTEDPINRCDEPPSDPEGREAMRAYYESDPARLRDELCLSVEGAEALRTRWSDMAGRLESEGYWHYPDKFAAIRMLGHRPEDSLDDPVAVTITLACRALHPEAWDAWHDHAQSRLGLEGRAIYYRRVEHLEKRQPGKQEAFEVLMGCVRAELYRLTCLLEGLRAKREVDRAAVVPLAMFDDSKEGMLRLRYEATWTRVLQKSISDLAKLQKDDCIIDDCEYDDDETAAETPAPAPESAPETSSEVESEEEVPSDESTQEAVLRNEPKAAPERRPEPGPEGPETGREWPETAPSGGLDGVRPVV